MSVKTPVPRDKVVGRRMRVRRRQLGLSQQALGDALGVSYQQVQKYEKGISRIGAGRLQQIAEILDVPISVFFDEKISESKVGDRFLDNPYFLRLFEAFSMMRDRRLQDHIVQLIEQVGASISAVEAAQVTALDCHIGARVRGRRLELRLSESSAAEALRCTIDYLRACEEGRAHISAALLFEISRVLEVEVSYFFDGVSVSAKLKHEHS
jgi:transcriptional regulator with XRE-family HTH domain